MAHWLRELTALAEDLGLDPSIHTKWLTTASNSNSKANDTFCWIPQPLTPTYTLQHASLKFFFFLNATN